MTTDTAADTATFTSNLRHAVTPGVWELSVETRFISTHCGCCGRSLKTPESVEAGIGPECSARYGTLTTRSAEPDMVAARTLIANLGAGVFAPDVLTCDDAATVAGVLMHRFSRHFRTARWIPDAVYALGYHKVAERMAKRASVKIGEGAQEPGADAPSVARVRGFRGFRRAPRVETVTIAVEGDTLVVRTPFNEGFNAALRETVAGRRWDSAAKAWRVPAAARPALWTALRGAFAGLTLTSPKGESVIPSLAD